MDRPLVLTLALCALLLSPTLAYRFGLDQGTFAYVAAELLEGRWPYVYTWDHQFPGGMVLHAIEILLLGKSIAMFRAFDLAYQLVNVFLIYRISERLAGRTGAFLSAAIYCLIYQGYGPWNTGQREGFALVFVLAGFWWFLTADRRPTVRTAALIGVTLGLASTIKPTFVAFAVMYLPLLRTTSLAGAWRPVPVALAMLVTPMLCFVGFYWFLGALEAAYEASVKYQTEVYVHRLRGTDPLPIYWWSSLRRLGGHAVGLVIFYLPFLPVGEMRRERLMLYLGYVASVLTVVVQGTFAGYHYLPGLGLGSVLIGSAFSTLTAGLERSTLAMRSRRFPVPSLAAAVLVIGAIPVYVDPGRIRDVATLRFLERPRPNEFRNRTVFDFTEDYDLAEYLRDRTDPDDRIQVWGHESLVYYLANRDAASRFQSSNPLVMRVPGKDISPMQRRWRAEFLRDVRRSPPRYVVVTRDDNWWWAPEERTSEQLLDDFPEWKAFIHDAYVPEHTIGRFVIHRHAASRPVPAS